MQNDKKMAAAMAAVTYYIKTQDEAAAMALAAQEEESVPAVPMNLWGVSGRQSQMQMRNLMQMRAFHGLRTPFK